MYLSFVSRYSFGINKLDYHVIIKGYFHSQGICFYF